MRAMNRLGAVAVVTSAMALAWGAETPRTGLPAKEGLEFKVRPSVKADGDNVTIEFEANKATDVAVEVLDNEGKAVRHLAAGLLGPYAPEPLATIREKLVAHLKDKGEITPPEFRELTGLSRKFMIPVLEYFDSEKLTIRVGDKRVARRK